MLGARLAALLSTVVIVAGAGCGHPPPGPAPSKPQTVWAWGSNWYGQIGNSVNGFVDVEPQRVNDLIDVLSVAAGRSHSVALTRDGSVWQWGSVGSNLKNVGGNSIRRCPHPTPGEYGNTYTTDLMCDVRPTKVSNLGKARQIAAGVNFTLAIMDDSTLCRWGSQSHGQLSNVTWNGLEVTDPVCTAPPTGVDFVLVDGGGGGGWSLRVPLRNRPTGYWNDAGHSLALAVVPRRPGSSEREFEVWAWGRNDHWQTGAPSSCADLCAQPLKPVPVPASAELANVMFLSAGGAHSLAVKTDHSVWAWGSQEEGQLGVPGKSDDISTPVRVVTNDTGPEILLDDVTDVAAGDNFSLALKWDRTVWAWGLNNFGQLGVPNELQRTVQLSARQVPGLDNVRKIAAGDSFALALKYDGTLWAWGRNDHGQLGVQTSDKCGPRLDVNCSFSPIQVNLAGVTEIAAGGAHSLALVPS